MRYTQLLHRKRTNYVAVKTDSQIRPYEQVLVNTVSLRLESILRKI